MTGSADEGLAAATDDLMQVNIYSTPPPQKQSNENQRHSGCERLSSFVYLQKKQKKMDTMKKDVGSNRKHHVTYAMNHLFIVLKKGTKLCVQLLV